MTDTSAYKSFLPFYCEFLFCCQLSPHKKLTESMFTPKFLGTSSSSFRVRLYMFSKVGSIEQGFTKIASKPHSTPHPLS